ncbi:alpha/beta hydrolase [Aciditerrimonas ferrireducens]|uniref:alpha/beta hydrolase n=1 Tax=Aciditerrimonas ferrireducens TaxID=667306 RepID=UPI002002E37A|nr:alpha/beta fold hydrolase [Aciditerrimonas ferrireducens]MCK4177789.1 S9 family peptidase [Aciditerrimonas ferrireducens]
MGRAGLGRHWRRRGSRWHLAYGPSRSQVGDLWLPDEPGVQRAAGERRPPAVVVLFHGGYWRMPYGRRLMVPLARGLVRHGLAVWNVEYRRVGLGGGGGGWPATVDDAARAVDALAARAEVDGERVVLVGHSAGGQLALWVAGRHRLPSGAAGARSAGQVPAVGIRGVVALAPVTDLRGTASGPVRSFLGPDPTGSRAEAASPRGLLPLGVPQMVVHGAVDEVVPVAASRAYVAAAREAGDDARLVEVPGVGHRGVILPRGPAWEALVGAACSWCAARR